MTTPNITPQTPSRDDHGTTPCPGLPPRLHPDRPAGPLQHRACRKTDQALIPVRHQPRPGGSAHAPSPGGQFRGHQWAETVATSGQVSWPPVGRNQCPLTRVRQVLLRSGHQFCPELLHDDQQRRDNGGYSTYPYQDLRHDLLLVVWCPVTDTRSIEVRRVPRHEAQTGTKPGRPGEMSRSGSIQATRIRLGSARSGEVGQSAQRLSIPPSHYSNCLQQTRLLDKCREPVAAHELSLAEDETTHRLSSPTDRTTTTGGQRSVHRNRPAFRLSIQPPPADDPFPIEDRLSVTDRWSPRWRPNGLRFGVGCSAHELVDVGGEQPGHGRGSGPPLA